MNNKELKEQIDSLVEEIVSDVSTSQGRRIESITLAGSYTTGKISLQRPNINILVFVKPNPPADLYLEIGKILYRIGKKYAQFFRVRVDPFPFRFARPIGLKEVEVSVNLNFYEMADKDLVVWVTPKKKVRRPFGAPEPVLQSFKFTRKVVFGDDVLGGMEFAVTREDILLNVIVEFPGTYRLQLTRAPLTYDVNQDYELLATEALEVGKSCLVSAAGVLLDEKSVRKGKHLEIVNDKGKLLEFLENSGLSDLAQWAKIILNARDNFLEIKKDKKEVFKLYDAAFNVLNMVFGIAASQVFKHE